MNSIILIGFMGAGKTTIGKKLAKELDYKFLDTDEMIVSREGMSINDIFDRYGEEHFRTLETELLAELVENNVENVIFSVGGGLPVRKDNHFYLKKLGKVIYLSVVESTIRERLAGDTQRPLLRGSEKEVADRINSMLEKRDPIYREVADIILQTDNMSVSEIVEEIIK